MLNINKQSKTPVYEQVISEFERLIMNNLIDQSEQIPSVRNLAVELCINPNTIQKAYKYLETRKITYSVPGVGRFVSETAKEIISKEYEEKLTIISGDVKQLKVAGFSLEAIIETVNKAYKEDN